MKRTTLGLATACFCILSLPAVGQEAGPASRPLAQGVSADGLEVAVVEITEAPQRDEFGQALVRMGSCPPGVAPAGMEGLMTVIPLPGRGAVVRLELEAATGSAVHELSFPVVIDTDGERHQPYGPSFLPEPQVLQRLDSTDEALVCEFPFDVNPENVKALEFEGLRLDVVRE